MLRENINNGQIYKAFEELEQRIAKFPGLGFADRLEALRTEFKYMTDFMLKGYKDEKRETIFRELVRRTTELDYDISVHETLRSSLYMKAKAQALANDDNRVEHLQEMLLAETEPEQQLNNIENVFYAVLLSAHWRQPDAAQWVSLLCGGGVGDVASSAVVGALTISCMHVASRVKTQLLVDVYHNATSAEVRQRALVGILLIVDALSIHEKELAEEMMTLLVQSEDDEKALLESVIQMRICANADADTNEIRDKIMPSMAASQPFRVTKDGIVEREDNEDSIDTEADERRIAAMEESVRKILDMQKNGSDFFFGGFKQMKRCSFFYRQVNWFGPFYMQHPGIQKELSRLKNSDFVNRVTSQGPFCGSDKYSFVIAIADIMGQLPENLRKMMNEGEVAPVGMLPEDQSQPTESMVRLQYLQDLYRFFRLNNFGQTMSNPFAQTARFAVWRSAIGSLSDATLIKMAHYVHAHRAEVTDDALVQEMLQACRNGENFDLLQLTAEMNLEQGDYHKAADAYSRCLKLKPDDTRCMRGIARALYKKGEYVKAAFYYDALHTMLPVLIWCVEYYVMVLL